MQLQRGSMYLKMTLENASQETIKTSLHIQMHFA